MGSSNENSHFGPVQNPWDHARGARRLLAAARPRRSRRGSRPAATGTDTGGSIRQPASLSGVCGLQAHLRRVSRYGMVAFASSLDQGGPLARSAEDLALLHERHGRASMRAIRPVVERAARGLRARPRHAARGAAHRRAARILRRRTSTPTCAQRGRARRSRELDEARRAAWSRSSCRTSALVGAGVLRDRAGRSLVQPVALRRRALRLSRAGVRGPERHVRARPARRASAPR